MQSMPRFGLPCARSLRAVAISAFCAMTLAACAETEFLVHTAKQQIRDDSSISTGDGRYKIGSPYQIRDAWYYPAEDFEYSETGIASWYGPNFHGKQTANGSRPKVTCFIESG